jgi:hypothetical protein
MDRTIPEHVASVGRVLDEVFTPEEEAELAGLLRRLRDYVLEQNLAQGGPCDGDEAEGLCPGD